MSSLPAPPRNRLFPGDLADVELAPLMSWASNPGPANLLSPQENITDLVEYDIEQDGVSGGETSLLMSAKLRANGGTYKVAIKRRYYQVHGQYELELIAELKSLRTAREIKVLRRLNHPNIINYIGVIFDTDPRHSPIMIVSTLYEQPNMLHYLRLYPHPPTFRFSWVLQLAEAITYLHENNIVHGNLRPENIALDNCDSSIRLIITDFSDARILGDDSFGPRRTLDIYHRYTPHEIAGQCTRQCGLVTKEGDVYAFALVALFILSGREAFEDEFDPSKWKAPITQRIITIDAYRLLRGERPARSEHPGPELCDKMWQLLEECWSQDATSRPTASVVLERLQEIGKRG